MNIKTKYDMNEDVLYLHEETIMKMKISDLRYEDNKIIYTLHSYEHNYEVLGLEENDYCFGNSIEDIIEKIKAMKIV
jgi:hypothetical protein